MSNISAESILAEHSSARDGEEVLPSIDEGIDTSDIPEPDPAALALARVRMPNYKAGTVVLSSTVLEWFKAQPGDYQANINKVLQDYIVARTQCEGGEGL
ncbi:MAG TPA: BrnA antitoxin family protein [Burkholderiaceae bacterium]|nr:BrnA antitoxin family protein [Burkholderiaceae bacterium]